MTSDTVWYNYATASAGTIININANDTTGNLNTAVEDVCPKGWNLPSKKQLDNNRNAANFNPVFGGYYFNGAPSAESTRGYWWGSEAYNGALRYALAYDGGNLYTDGINRRNLAFYIRCVSEEKTVTDLTYMQDMTPQIARALSL